MGFAPHGGRSGVRGGPGVAALRPCHCRPSGGSGGAAVRVLRMCRAGGGWAFFFFFEGEMGVGLEETFCMSYLVDWILIFYALPVTTPA